MKQLKHDSTIFNIENPEFFINLKKSDIPPENSIHREAFVLNEFKKCDEGLNVNGVFIPPTLYYDLNFHKIELDTPKGRTVANPYLRDNGWVIHNDFYRAQKEKKHYCIAGSRQISKTDTLVSLTMREINLYKNTEALLLFGSSNDKSTFSKKSKIATDNGEKFLVVPTLDNDWRKDEIRYGYKEVDNTDNIHARLYLYITAGGNNAQVGSGKSLSFFAYDEIAKFPFKQSWNAIKPAFKGKYGYRNAGFFSFTGGEAELSKDAESFFLNPEANELLEFDYEGKKVGRFMGGWYRADFKKEIPFVDYLERTGNKIERGSCLDKLIIEVTDFEYANTILDKEEKLLLDTGKLSDYNDQRIFFPRDINSMFLKTADNPFSTFRVEFEKLLKYLESIEIKKIDFDEQSKSYNSAKLPLFDYPYQKNNSALFDSPLCVVDEPRLLRGTKLYCAGCLPPNEKVLTDKGLLNIQDISFDEKLINKEGDYVEINNIQIYEVKEEPIYTLKVSNTLRTTTFTKEHPIYVSNHILDSYRKVDDKNFKFEFREVKNVKNTDWIKVPNIYLNKNNFNIDDLWIKDVRIDFNIKSPLKNSDFWWFIGLYLGDGWCETGKGAISVSFNKNENQYIEKYKRVIKNLFNRKVSKSKEKENCVEYKFNSLQLWNFLNLHFGKYASNKILPEWSKKISNQCKSQLLLGYLNSDGCLYKNTKDYYSMEFVSINLNLLESFQDIGFSLGCVSNLQKLRDEGTTIFRDKVSKTKICYHLRFGHNDTLKLANLMNDETDLKLSKIDWVNLKVTNIRKNKGCFLSKDLKYIYFQITGVNESKYTGNVYNFECETNSFMCHHITTHNCDPFNTVKTAESASLGSFYIMRRETSDYSDSYNNRIVAWYNGRKDISHFRKILTNSLEFYGAELGCITLLHEASDDNLTQHFSEKNKSHYLEDTYTLSREINPNANSYNSKGLRPTPRTQNYGLQLIIDYCEEELPDGKLGLWRIPDPYLVKQLMNFDGDYSDKDAIIAFLHALIHLKKESKYRPNVSERVEVKEKPKIVNNAFGMAFSNYKKSAI